MELVTSKRQRFLYHVSIFHNRLTASFSSEKYLHNARFAYPYELNSLVSPALDTTSLLLGEGAYNHLYRVQATKKRKELGNVLVNAITRGVKGLLATSQLLTWEHSVIVNDIKGELFNKTAGYRSLFSDIYCLGINGEGHRYDPLLNKNTDDALMSSASHLLYRHDEREGIIFTERATVMLAQILLAARLENCLPLPYVREIVRLGLVGAARRLFMVSPDLATQFLDVELKFANFEDRFLLSCWGTLSARMRLLLTETVVKCFTGSDFTAKDIMCRKRPVTVYLRWPERDLLVLSPLVRLMWGSLIDELIHTYDSVCGQNCKPVLLLIDEAGRTAIPSLADHATTVSGRGISLWIAIQSLSQLDAIYGRSRAQILRDNMESQIYYRPSNHETAEYLEKSLGRRSGFAHSHTSHEGIDTSEGQSEQGIPLLTAQQIKQMPDDEIIGWHRGLPPFRAKRMDFRHFPVLVNRAALKPPTLAPLPDAPSRFLPVSNRFAEPRHRLPQTSVFNGRQAIVPE